jgi:hypothetical protein
MGKKPKKKKTATKPKNKQPRLSCGSVAKNVGTPPQQKTIKHLVLEAAAQPVGKPLPDNTPDDTKISTLRPGDNDSITTLTGLCMNLPGSQFQSDGLWMNRLYALTNGKTLGTFVSCIQCCYSHGRAVKPS